MEMAFLDKAYLLSNGISESDMELFEKEFPLGIDGRELIGSKVNRLFSSKFREWVRQVIEAKKNNHMAMIYNDSDFTIYWDTNREDLEAKDFIDLNANRLMWDSEGVTRSIGIESSSGIVDCVGLSHCNSMINSCFCIWDTGKNKIFGKEVEARYAKRVIEKIKRLTINTFPLFLEINNIVMIDRDRSNKKMSVDIGYFQTRMKWEDMSDDAVRFIASLDEFNDEIFTLLTGILICKSHNSFNIYRNSGEDFSSDPIKNLPF